MSALDRAFSSETWPGIDGPAAPGSYHETLQHAKAEVARLRADSAKLARVLSVISEHKLAELHGKATRAPWSVVPDQPYQANQRIESAECVDAEGRRVASLFVTAWKVEGRDARPSAHLIAALRNALPHLLAALGELKSGEKPAEVPRG